MARYLDTDIYAGIRYTPETFQERALLPVALRERHDAADEYIDSQLTAISNMKIHNKLKDEYVSNKTEEVNNELNSLAENMYSSGAGNMSNINKFKSLKRKVDKELSLTGGLGSRANITSQYDKQRELAVAHGSKLGFSPDQELAWVNTSFNDYVAGITNSDGSLNLENAPDFTASFAPSKFDTMKFLAQIKNTTGFQSVLDSGVTVTPTIDTDTGMIVYNTESTQTLDEDNRDALNKVESAINSKINDPNSDMYISKRRAMGPDASHEEIVNALKEEILPLLESQFYSKNTTQRKNEAKIVGGGSGSGGGSGNDSKEENKASLDSMTTGNEISDPRDLSRLNDEINYYERKEATVGLTQEEIYIKGELIRQKYAFEQKMNDPLIQKEINNRLKEDKKEDLNTINKNIENKINDYKNAIIGSKEGILPFGGNPEYYEELYKESVKTYLNNNPEQRDSVYYDESGFPVFTNSDVMRHFARTSGDSKLIQREGNLANIVNRYSPTIKSNLDIISNVTKDVINSQSLLYNNKFTISAGEAGNKLGETLNKSAQRIMEGNWSGLLGNNGGMVTRINSDGTPEVIDGAEISSEGSNFRLGANAKISFDGITDRGKSGLSYITFTYTDADNKAKPRGAIHFNLNRENLSNEVLYGFLKEIYNNVDTKSQQQLNAIMDNHTYANISVDGEEWKEKGTSDFQSDIITGHANSNFKTLISQVGEAKAREYDYFNKFAGKNDPIRSNIIQDKDGFFTMTQESKNTEPDTITYDQWTKRNRAMESAAGVSYKPGSLISRDLNLSNDNSDRDKEQLNLEMASLAQELEQGKGASIRIGGSPEEQENFRIKANEFLRAYDEAYQYGVNNNKQYEAAIEQYNLALEFYSSIKNKTVSFKNSNKFFKSTKINSYF